DPDVLGDVEISQVTPEVLADLPRLSFTTTFPRFIRDAGTSHLYWTDGHTMRFVRNNSERNEIAASTGVPNHTMTIPSAAVSAFPNGGPVYPPGDVVGVTGSNARWLLEGLDTRRRVPAQL